MNRPAFPQPQKLSPAVTRWRLSDLVAYEAETSGGQAQKIDQEVFLNVGQVAKRYGVSVATVWRWSAASGRASA